MMKSRDKVADIFFKFMGYDTNKVSKTLFVHKLKVMHGKGFATLSHNSCLLHFQLFQSNIYSTSDKNTVQ